MSHASLADAMGHLVCVEQGYSLVNPKPHACKPPRGRYTHTHTHTRTQLPRLCSLPDRFPISKELRELVELGMAPCGLESVHKYDLQQPAQQIETLHSGVFAQTQHNLLLSSGLCHTGAAGKTPLCDVAGA